MNVNKKVKCDIIKDCLISKNILCKIFFNLKFDDLLNIRLCNRYFKELIEDRIIHKIPMNKLEYYLKVFTLVKPKSIKILNPNNGFSISPKLLDNNQLTKISLNLKFPFNYASLPKSLKTLSITNFKLIDLKYIPINIELLELTNFYYYNFNCGELHLIKNQNLRICFQSLENKISYSLIQLLCKKTCSFKILKLFLNNKPIFCNPLECLSECNNKKFFTNVRNEDYYIKFITILIDYGCKIVQENDYKLEYPLLHILFLKRSFKILLFLIEKGMNPNILNKNGFDFLYYATKNNFNTSNKEFYSFITTLFKNNIDLCIKNKQGNFLKVCFPELIK